MSGYIDRRISLFLDFHEKSKQNVALYASVCDDFGVVEKLTTSAVERHQNRCEPIQTRSTRGRVLISAFFVTFEFPEKRYPLVWIHELLNNNREWMIVLGIWTC